MSQSLQNVFISSHGAKKFGYRGMKSLFRVLEKVEKSCQKYGYSTQITIIFPIRKGRLQRTGLRRLGVEMTQIEWGKKAVEVREEAYDSILEDDVLITITERGLLEAIAKALSEAYESGLREAANIAINVTPCESICHCASEAAEEILSRIWKKEDSK